MRKHEMYSDGTCKLLISLVKRNRMLYDRKHPEYNEVRKKNQVWIKIAKRVRMPVKNTRRLWTYMRDYYRRIIRNINLLPPDEAALVRRYRYEKEIKFVKPFLKSDVGYNENETNDHQNTESGSLNASSENESENDGESFDIDNDNDNCTVDNDENADNEHSLDIESAEELFIEGSSSKKRKYESESDDEEESADEEECEVETLFESLGQTVRKFDPVTQALTKHKISSFVFELELTFLKQNNAAKKVARNSSTKEVYHEFIEEFEKD